MAPDDLELLFDPSVLPSSSKVGLDSDLHLRPLSSTDHSRGHFDVLSVLTEAPRLSSSSYAIVFDHMKACPNTYYTIVIVNNKDDKIVGCGTIVIERKFTRSGNITGHIEDIAVSKGMQGRKLGLKIINTLEEIGRKLGCYKIILDCSKENIPFYEKCGFKHKEFQMVRYMQDPILVQPPTPSRL